MEAKPLLQREIPGFLSGIHGVSAEGNAIMASKANIVEILRKCKENGFWLADLCAVENADSYDIVYQLWDYGKREMLTVKARNTKWGPMPSVVSIWKYANWHEREAFDMFGVVFDGHPNLKRILLPEDWNDIPPLRKEFRSQNLRDAHRVILDASPEEWALHQTTEERYGEQVGKKVGARLEEKG